jgi:hypothetical protein
VPTVYVPPTAQTAPNARIIGLPVDYAGLRGEEEAGYLAGLGVDRGRLDVVGNPTVAEEAAPRIDPGLPAVFAPGLEDEARLGPLVGVVREGLGDRVVVGRHPSAGVEVEGGAFPPGWRIFEGRTYELLRAGPAVVVQHSSGVALEALHLGIPVVELSYPGKAALYPLIREPYVRFASTGQQLREAVAAASGDAGDPGRRRELIEWARGWSWPNGAEAGQRAVALVETALARGPRGPIWEPWQTTHTALA